MTNWFYEPSKPYHELAACSWVLAPDEDWLAEENEFPEEDQF
jgi:hypothetical protein